jgi:hypothetical protein
MGVPDLRSVRRLPGASPLVLRNADSLEHAMATPRPWRSPRSRWRSTIDATAVADPRQNCPTTQDLFIFRAWLLRSIGSTVPNEEIALVGLVAWRNHLQRCGNQLQWRKLRWRRMALDGSRTSARTGAQSCGARPPPPRQTSANPGRRPITGWFAFRSAFTGAMHAKRAKSAQGALALTFARRKLCLRWCGQLSW